MFRAWVVDSEKGQLKSLELRRFPAPSALPQQDPAASVTVRVHYSTLNYKDAMILGGQAGVVRNFPIVPGIDFAGEVEESQSPLWRPGDKVVLTGNKAGQFFDGGFSELCRVQAEWLVPCPPGISLEQSMIIGSAGFTAMQMVLHLQTAGNLHPGKGPVLVTGAAGGVGGAAVAILARLGYEVVASSGRAQGQGESSTSSVEPYLRQLGASQVIPRLEGGRERPLQKQRWAAVVDTVGGPVLAAALAQTKYLGSVACVGVAAGGELDTTVYPFVLRGIRLLGVDSTLPWNVAGYDEEEGRPAWERHRQERLNIWENLGKALSPAALTTLHAGTAAFEDLPLWGRRLLAGSVWGRLTVRIS